MIPTLFLLLGCHPAYTTLDEACPESAPGTKDLDADPAAFLTRLACHRRMARIHAGRGNVKAQQASDAHADWFETQYTDGASFTFTEELGTVGFVGRDYMERLQYTGWMGQERTEIAAVREVALELPEGTGPAEAADLFMAQVYARDVTLHPAWWVGGYAVAHDWHALSIAIHNPPDRHMNRLVTYPADGQTGVPTSWDPSGWARIDDEVPKDRLVGYPFTLVVGGEDAVADVVDTGSTEFPPNPYGLTPRNLVILGPDGSELAAVVVEPDGTSPLELSVGLVPLEPLEPNTTYTVQAEVDWAMKDRKRLEVEFTTGS